MILSGADDPGKRVFHTSINKLLATLDPALAADTACQFMTASFYDTPLQYDFRARPYRLEPSMLAEMPEFSPDGKTMTCRLRDDLFFQKNECFRNDSERKVDAQDFIFSMLRLADPRLRSTGYWLIRGKIEGLDEFREAAQKLPSNDFSVYDRGCSGLERVDAKTFRIHLTHADPRFVYAMAMPYFSVVSRKAVEYWGDSFGDHPAGTGPFILDEWQKDFRLRMVRNPEYRKESFEGAAQPGDRKLQLPLCDEIVCNLIKQPIAGWLLFLQGNLDSYALDGDTFAAVVNRKLELSPALTRRGIELLRAPESQTNYIGFCFSDPLLASNENLRKAISLAFNRERRIEHAAGRFVPAYGPVPPGTAGFLEEPGEFSKYDPALAREYMKKAGFPDGVDPKTGKPLEITFDQAGSDTLYLQMAEMMAIDLKEIGIQMKPEFNNRARFLQKLALGKVQLFRLSWTGDYPDAENFLQLFYSKNAGGSNRVSCSFPDFDREFERVSLMRPSAERDREYTVLAEMIRAKCPWIFESFTVAFILRHSWVTNLEPHDFAFNRWKYVAVDPEQRIQQKKSFTPFSMKELRHNEE